MREALAVHSHGGNVLVTVLAALLAVSAIGLALVSSSSQSLKTATWGRDHLALRLLAESASEELFLHLQERSTLAADPLLKALCQIPKDAGAAPIPLAGLEPTLLAAELPAQEKALGAGLTVSCAASITKLAPLSDDPIERAGVVRLEATAQLGRRPLASTERVRVSRVFRIARIVPTMPLDQVGLFVAMPSRALPKFPRNTAAFAAVTGHPRSLLELVTQPPPDGLQAIQPASRKQIVSAIGGLAPGSLARRAQYVTSSVSELEAFLGSRLRAGLPVNGVVHNLSREDVQISFPAFLGKCVLSLAGPVKIGDIRLKDPTRDSLTIASAGRMLVSGKTVQAVLVNFNDTREGIVFEQRAEIYGGLLAGVFPGGRGLSDIALEDCRIEHDPYVDVGGATASAPDPALLSHYCVAFSPHPASVEHARDREDWSGW